MTLSEMVLKTLSSLCRVWIGRRGDGLNPPPPDELSFFLPFYYFFLSSSRSSTSLFFPPLFCLLPPVTSLPWDALSSTTPTHLNVILTKWKRAQSFKLVTCFDVAARRGKRWILPSFFFGTIIVVTPSVIWIQNIPWDLDGRCFEWIWTRISHFCHATTRPTNTNAILQKFFSFFLLNLPF